MMKKSRALEKRFFRHGGIYRSDVSLPLANLGRGPAFRSGPGQAIGRAGCHTPCPSFAMSSGRLFLDGSVATVARLRFADQSTIKSGRNHNKHFSSNGNQCLNWLSQPRGPLHVVLTPTISPKTRKSSRDAGVAGRVALGGNPPIGVCLSGPTRQHVQPALPTL